MKRHSCKIQCFILLFLISINLLRATESIVLNAPDGTDISINRDEFGVPHIVAESETGVFFGQGFAVAQDRLYQLEYYRMMAQGNLAELLGSSARILDVEIRRMFYTEAERRQQFVQLPDVIQGILIAYRDGINTYLDSMAVNPQKYTPLEFKNRTFERWTVYNSIAITQVLARLFGQFGGEELNRLAELQGNGQEWFDLNRPINDETAPTTIQNGAAAETMSWDYSNVTVDGDVIRSLQSKKRQLSDFTDSHPVPAKLGSFATLIAAEKSNSSHVMLLGAPQMGAPDLETTPLVNEVELICPTLHVGGVSLAGYPLVLIGHTEYHAWTLTSGKSDNSDVFIDSTLDASYTKYYYNGNWIDFEVIQDTLSGSEGETVFTHYRTVHGPVFGDDLSNLQVFSNKTTFWNQELDILKGNYDMIRAGSLNEFEEALALNPMSFNVFYADQDQNVKFWHVGKYQDRRDGIDPRLPHKGDGTEEWQGFIAFEDLPQADNSDQDYFANWNNKPVSWWNNGDDTPWIGPNHVTRIRDFIGPLAAVTFENLKDIPRQINDRGTYQQAIELPGTEFVDENILPPGQSAFVNLAEEASQHLSDQWPLHLEWQYKDMQFVQTVTNVANDNLQIPTDLILMQNYPNPFNPETSIVFEISGKSQVSLRIYNIKGQLVKTLVNGQYNVGRHRVLWDGTDLHGRRVGSGIYIYQIHTGGLRLSKKMVFIE